MSWECRYFYNGFCRKRDKECIPGEPGCILYGKYSFPLKEDKKSKKDKKNNQKAIDK